MWRRAFLILAIAVARTAAAEPENPRAADEKLLQEAGLKTDGPALLDFFRKRTLSEADIAKLAKAVRQLGDKSFTVREKAAADLVAAGRNALPSLRRGLKDPDLEIARRAQECIRAIENGPGALLAAAASRLLADRQPTGATQVILNYFPFADDETVEEELLTTLGIVGVRGGKADPLLIAAVKDAKPVRRAAAAFVLGRLADRDLQSSVRSLLRDRDPKVRWQAAQGLVAGKDKEAVATLVALLGDAPAGFALQAEELLCRIAGEQAPAVSLGLASDADRKKCRDAWAGWWQNHRDKTDLAKLDSEQRLLGLTMIAACDGYNGGRGQVWEIGPDRKPRWTITDVQGPNDIQMLPGNRVLISEHGARRVSERDLQGKVLWQHNVKGNPHDVQRLPNGNTFISTWPNQILEVDRNGKEVFSHTARIASVSSGRKLRNGHYAYVTQASTLVEVDQTGQEVKVLKLDYQSGFRMGLEELPGGRFLISFEGAGKVVEFDNNGKALWECNVPHPTGASRLSNGHTLVCSNENRAVEVDRAGKVVWEEKLQGRPFRLRRR